MAIQIYEKVEIPIGAPLKTEEIDILDESLQIEAEKERVSAIEENKKLMILAFYENLRKKYLARNFDSILSDIAYTKIEINENLKEFAKIVLVIRLTEPIDNGNEAKAIIYAINKIGGSLKENSWKERVKVRITKTENIVFLIETMKDRWDNDKLQEAIIDWENRQRISPQTLRARDALGLPVETKRFLEEADKRLEERQFVCAVRLYRTLLDLGVDIGDKRQKLIGASGRGHDQCDQSNKIEKTARKLGLLASASASKKPWWKFW